MSLYQRSMLVLDKCVPNRFQPIWQHAAGPKTVFFWAPFFKWGLVVAGLSDLRRPVDKISIPQSLSLAMTGLIWSRYSLVIVPKNYGLFSVNIFVGITNFIQLSRALRYKMEQEKEQRT